METGGPAAESCKTNCPACSRVCPEAAIIFPKYASGPINGDVVSDADLKREKMKVDISALLGGFDETLYVSEELDFSRRLKRLARRRGQRMIVLPGVRLLTSARKLDLYSWRELAGFIWRYLRHPRRTPRDPQACPIWYDGRR